MPSPSPFAPVLRALLRDLLAAEFSLYAATRTAVAGATRRSCVLLQTQARELDAALTQVAWQLGTWGDCMLLDAVAAGTASARAGGVSTLERLRTLHEALVDRLNQFMARTSQLRDEPLAQLLADLRARHEGAAAALDHENRFSALPDDEHRFDPFPRSASFNPCLLPS